MSCSLGEFNLTTLSSIGKIATEHELKDPKSSQATLKAIREGYVKSTPLKNGTPFFMWHLKKTKALISKQHDLLSPVDF